MNNEQQTAVQILVDSLIKLGYLHSNEFGQSLKVTEVINQAKEMHKRQIKNAFINGYLDSYNAQNNINADEIFYEKTYGGNK
jgi:hypothetical protein